MNRRSKKFGKIPGPTDWAGYEEDLEVKYAHNLFFGKSVPEIMEHFSVGGRCIERADKLLFIPRRAFQCYIQAFAKYIKSEEAVSDSDSASPFLRLLLNREERAPGSVMEIYSRLSGAVDFVASHQDYFDAPKEIYGSFQELGNKIRTVYKNYIGSI